MPVPHVRDETERKACVLSAVTTGERGAMLLAALVLLAAVGCGTEVKSSPPQEEAPGRGTQSLVGSNGLAFNGLAIDRMVIRGLATSGLANNGLVSNGLASPGFITWFNQEPVMADTVMKYVVYCALRQGHQLGFVNPATGITHAWEGGVNLAHHWSDGRPATVDEQQLVSACLAAHANTYGLHVSFSLLGETSSNRSIDIAKGELEEYDTREACFFGNLFNGEGLHAGNDRNALLPRKSTPRPCGLSRTHSGEDSKCSAILRVGSCENLSCTMDREARYYRTCTYNETQYRVLTTRLRTSDVYTCGDGICQVSERCGMGTTADNCGLDCGPCG